MVAFGGSFGPVLTARQFCRDRQRKPADADPPWDDSNRRRKRDDLWDEIRGRARPGGRRGPQDPVRPAEGGRGFRSGTAIAAPTAGGRHRAGIPGGPAAGEGKPGFAIRGRRWALGPPRRGDRIARRRPAAAGSEAGGGDRGARDGPRRRARACRAGAGDHRGCARGRRNQANDHRRGSVHERHQVVATRAPDRSRQAD